MDTTKPTENDGQHLPALWKRGAGEVELKVLCNKYEACVAVHWGNEENGYLRFSSAAALDAIDEPGWGKWSDGCQSGCFPNGAGDGGGGVCHVKQSGFSLSRVPLIQRLCMPLSLFLEIEAAEPLESALARLCQDQVPPYCCAKTCADLDS